MSVTPDRKQSLGLSVDAEISAFSDYATVTAYLYAQKARGPKFGVERMRRLAAALGHPERSYPVVHVASWPAFVSPVVNLGETILTMTRGVAYSMGCFVLNATGVLTQDVIDVYQATAEPRAFLDRLLNQGYASIIAPSGQVISQPIQGEGIVYADVDLNDIITRKIALDYAGHYSRPDVFDFQVKVRE